MLLKSPLWLGIDETCIGLFKGLEGIIAQGSSVTLHTWMYGEDRGVVGRDVDCPPSWFLPYLRCVFFPVGALIMSRGVRRVL